MCVPGGRSSVAKPMIWLYLRSGSPFFTARVRILWPGGTRLSVLTSPSTLVLGRMSMRATTTLSLGCRRMVIGAGMVVLLGRALGADAIDCGEDLAALGLAERAQRRTHPAPGQRVVAAMADQRLHRGRHRERQHDFDHGGDPRLLDAVQR